MINISMILVGHCQDLASHLFLYLSSARTLFQHHNLNPGNLWVCAMISRPTYQQYSHPTSSPFPPKFDFLFSFFPLWQNSSHPSERGTCLSVTHMSRISAPQTYLPRTALSHPSISLWILFLHLCSVPLFLALKRNHRVLWHGNSSQVIHSPGGILSLFFFFLAWWNTSGLVVTHVFGLYLTLNCTSAFLFVACTFIHICYIS